MEIRLIIGRHGVYNLHRFCLSEIQASLNVDLKVFVCAIRMTFNK